MSLGMPYNTKLSNRRWASRHLPSQRRLQFQIKPRAAYRTYDTILTNWQRASRRQQKILHIAYMSLVKAHKTLEIYAERRDADSRFHIRRTWAERRQEKTVAKRRRLKIPYIVCMSPGKQEDANKTTPSVATSVVAKSTQDSWPQGNHKTTLAKWRLSSRRRLKKPSVASMSLGSHKTRRWQTDEHRDAIRSDADYENDPSHKKPREAIWHNAGKPTSSVATPILPTPTLDTIFSVY
jgi:hypothetical protein